MAIATLGFKIDSKDARRAAKDLDGLDKSAGAATVAAKGLGKAAGLAGVAIAAAFSLGAVVRGIADFDHSMSRLGAVSRATATDLAAMRDISKELGSTTEFSAMQAADGLNFLAMAGFSAAESMAAIPAVLDLATASGMGLAQAADTASNIMSGFGIAAENAANVSDVLAAASTRANTDVYQLGQAMATVAPVSAALGIGLEDTAAAIGVLSDAGIQGARAGTAMRGVLASLAGPTDGAIDVLEQLGLTIEDINPETNALSVVMGRLGAAGLSTADAMTLFGREAASGALVLIEGSKRLGEFGQELRGVDGAAGDMAGTMRDNLKGDLQGAMSAVEGLIIALGDAGLTAILRGVVKAVTDVTRFATKMVDAFGAGVDAVQGLLGNMGTQARAQVAMQLAVDNTTVAIGDQVNATNWLSKTIANGSIMSLEAAEAELAKAEARREDIAAMVEQRVEQARQSDYYQGIVAQIIDAQSALAGMGERTTRNAAAMDAVEQSLVGLLKKQSDFNDAILAGSNLTEEEAAHKKQVEANIAELRKQVDLYNDASEYSVDLSQRLSGGLSSISFSNALSGAQSLAKKLNIFLHAAMQMMGLLGATQDAVNYDPGGGGGSGGGGGGTDSRQSEAARIIESLRSETEKYNDELRDLKELQKLGYLSTEQFTEAQRLLREQFETSHFAKEREQIDKFTDALFEGKEGLRDFVKTALSEFAKFQFSKGLQSLLGVGGGRTGGGGFLGKIFAGFFDAGGNIPAGQFGIAGENGPEIIKGPANVTSTRDTAKMMGGTQSLNVSVSVDEGGGLLAFVRDEAGRVVAQSKPSIVRESVGATYAQMSKTKAGR